MEAFLGKADYFALFIFRTAAFFATVPILGTSIRNRTVKVALSSLLAFAIFPICADPAWKSPGHPFAFLILIARETLIGIYLSFVLTLTLSAVRMAGELIGMEMGLSLAAQVDPITGSSTQLIAYLYEIIAVLLFFGLNLHHFVIQALVSSYELLPVGERSLFNMAPEFFIQLFRQMFSAGLVLAAPVFVVLALVSLCMGFLARAVPNFNLLDAGYTLRVGAAFGAMILFMPGFISAAGKLLGGVRESMFGLIYALS